MPVSCRRTLVVSLFIMIACVASATAATFTAAASGDWSTPATWTFSGTDADGIPDGDDTVSVPSTRVVTVTGAQSILSVSVPTGGTLTLNPASTLTLVGTPSSSYTNTGTTDGTGSVIIQGTGSIIISGTFTAPLVISGTVGATGSTIGGALTVTSGGTVNTSNQTFVVNGNLTVDEGGTLTKTSGTVSANGATIVNNGTINGGSITFGGGAQTYSGSGVVTAAFNIPNATTLTLASSVTLGNGATATSLNVNTGGTLATAGNVLTLNGGACNSSFGTISGAGTVRIQGTSTMNLGGLVTSLVEINSGSTTITGNNLGGPLTIANGATLNITNQTLSVAGDLNINAGGTLDNGIATSGTLNASGANIVNNGTISIGSFVFARSGAQSFSGSGTLIDSLTVLNGSVTSLASDITVGDGVAATTLVVNTGGTLAVGGFTLTCNRVAVSGSGASTSTGTGKIRTQNTSSIAIGAAFTGSLEINSGTTTASGTIGGSLTVASGATFNSTNQTIVVNGLITVDAGGTMIKTSSSVNANGPGVVNNGTITGGTLAFIASGAQSFSGSGSTVAAVSVNNGSTTSLTSDVSIGNGVAVSALTVNTGGSLAVGAFTLTFNGGSVSGTGASTSTGAGRVRIQGTSTLSVSAAFTALIEINGGSTTMGASSTIGGPLTISNAATMNIVNLGILLIGDLNIASGGLLTSSSGSGSFTVNSSNVINNGSVTQTTFRFNTGSQTLSGTGAFTAAVQVLNTSTTTLASDHQFGTLTVNTGGTFSTGSFTAFLSGVGTSLSGTGTMANINATYNGIAAQTVQTASVSYNRLGIDNAAGVTLSAAETVASRLILANGTFNSGAFLTLSVNATIARANGTLAIAPTFLGVINIEYFGSNPIGTGLEIPPTNTINDLTDNNTNTVTLGNSLTVNGNTVLAPGSTLTGGGGTALTFNGASFTNNGTESVPTTTFNGGPNTIAGTGAWTGGVFQLSGASAASLANSVTFSNGSFSVPVGTSVATGGSILTFDGTTFSNAGTVTGAVRTTGTNVGLTAGGSGFNASLNVNAGTTTASGVVNGPLTVDLTATGLMVPATLTVTGNSTVNAPLSGAGTVRVNGSTISNNATVGVSAFQFGGAAQALTGSGSFSGNMATILSGSNTTLTSDKQMGSVAINAGGTFNIANRTLLLSGGGTPLTTAGTFTITGSTVEYNGTGAQALPAAVTTYNNLSLSNAAGVTGFTGLTVGNLLRVKAGTFTSSSNYKDVQIDAGATLAGINGTTINVTGNWVNGGTFSANNNTVNFNGPAGQSIGGTAATTFNNLVAATAAPGLILGQNATVDGVLTLTSDVTTGAFTLTMPSSATSAGAADVLGSVRRTGFTGGGSALSFGNPFNSIAFAAGGSVPADVTVNLVKMIPTGFPAAIQRTYTITPNGGSGYTSTVRLHYTDAELNGNTEATLKLWSFVGFWGLRGSTAANTTNNWVEQSGVTQFSPWTLSSGVPPKITGRVTYENTAVPNVPVAGTTMTASGSPNAFGTTDANGDYIITMMGLGSYTVTPSRPDMSSAASNGIFSNDAALISRHIVGLTTLNATQIKAAKVGGQPTLTSLDAGLIAQWIVGIPNVINQTGKWKFTPTERVYASVLTDQSNQDHTALLLGDVNGDWVPGIPFAEMQGRSAKDPVIASTGKISASPGDQVSIPVRIDELKGIGVSSYQFDLEYDPDVITPLANAASVTGTHAEGLAVASNVVEPGLLKVVVFGPVPVSGDGVYADLGFTVIGKEGASSSLKLRDFRFNDGLDEVSAVEGRINVGPPKDEPALTGTLLTPTGEPVMAAEVTLTSTAGDVRSMRSDHSGQFWFDGLVLGETYTILIASRRYKFDPISVSMVDSVTAVDIIAR